MDVTKKSGFSKFLRKLNRQKILLLMVLPGMIFIAVFTFYPIYFAQIAFRNYSVVYGTNVTAAPWCGLQHFQEFFSSPDLVNIMVNTLGISFFKILFGFPIPIIFAIMLNELRSVRFKKTVQTVTYLPHFLSWAILGGIMIMWLSDYGFFTQLLYHLHIIGSPTNLLANPNYFWTISVVSDIWKEFGWNSIIYIAAIASIDQELFEAAKIDGAGKLAQIKNVTLPCITPTIVIMFILTLSYILSSNFDQIFILKNAANIQRSQVIDTYVYDMSFVFNRFDYATAVGLFKSVISLFILLIASFTSKRALGRSLFY